MAVQTYSAAEVSVIIGGVPMQGYADGDFLTIENVTPTYADVSGADGEVARIRSSDARATITLTLMQSSPSNDVLSALINADRLSSAGLGIVPFMVRDRSGRSLYSAAQLWVTNDPSSTFSKDLNTRAWEFRAARLVRFDAGNADGGLV